MKKNNNVIEQKVDHEILVIPIINGVAQMKQVCCLSESGTLIWEMLSSDVDISEDEIIAKVATHYNVLEDDIKSDIANFINDMKAQQIIY